MLKKNVLWLMTILVILLLSGIIILFHHEEEKEFSPNVELVFYSGEMIMNE